MAVGKYAHSSSLLIGTVSLHLGPGYSFQIPFASSGIIYIERMG